MEGHRGPQWFLTALIIDEERSWRGKRSFPCEWLTHQITQTLTNQITANQPKIVLHWYEKKKPKQMTSSIPFCFEALWPFSLAWQWPGCRHHLALRRFSGDAFVTKASLISFVRNTGICRASGQFRAFIKIRLANLLVQNCLTNQVLKRDGKWRDPACPCE